MSEFVNIVDTLPAKEGIMVTWEDVYKLATRLDKEKDAYGNEGLANKLVNDGKNVRPNLPYITTSKDKGIVNLGSDPTAPFGIERMGKEGGVEIKLYQRFEFAYYNW
jgi:hypothetical protein